METETETETRSVMVRYYADKTRLTWDSKYFKNRRGHKPRTDPGLGLFQHYHGQFDLHVFGADIVSIERKNLHSSQRRYQMESGYDEDYVIVPTVDSIKDGEVPLPFGVNHCGKNPTHRLRWVPHSKDYPHSHYVLEVLREIRSGTEVTFDYKL